ncbi:hypothetical protein ABB37_00091 [Leptomonas pyrrhocoris]|uniref:AAA+ ATPase domain-containing protein n=1 Tax=Leptomonas pyrrhocoris TaxID=157538 RepID=A0A0N0DZW0_LEPPY|nr:hypothetical protein ABB37_00091 [Leptomonas pyrrhocoris]XP_015664162.1 hypothetical protein ABB37_00091 [Leptomonas pyrrhocoris]KPA85722.1 hypothetical protein ABB37_00091 [Leptomonas pyrrhocoris]KPA85723.1 hypothetical protein ABB37_00091 [Leptomonas pyrrhocoris]|eukprot:XP_015664161.1 hypothetical protein ABB37_00091 [Leptomonas pyrrhocoris]
MALNSTAVAAAANHTLQAGGAGFIQHQLESSFQMVANFVAGVFDLVEQRVPVFFLCALLILVPLLAGTFRALTPFVESMWMACTSVGGTAGGLPYIHRNIEVRLPPLYFVRVPNHNVFLQNAVLVYVCHHLWREHPLPAQLLKCKKTAVDLMDPYRSWRCNVPDYSPFQAGAPLAPHHDDEQKLKLSELDRLRVVRVPMDGWVPVLEDNIELSFHEESYTLVDYSKPWTRRRLTLRCRATPGAAARLDAFVKRALELYAENAPSKEEDDARWFYSYCGEAEGKVFFQQYVLRSNKGFDTLFFPRRDATLTLIDQFVQRRGRFAVEGFPQKLGFLLYGPAGTGRHTFVKALAAYTGRHIVSVPLPKLRTNQQLYDIFFVRDFRAEENGSAQRLRMEDVIFLFDDVDASEPVVCARAARRVVQRRAAARLTAREGDGDGDGGALTNCVIEMDTSSSRPVLRAEESALPLAMLMDLVLGGVAAAGGSGAGAGGDAGSTKEEGAGGASDGGHGKRKKGKRDAGAGGAKGGDAVGPDALGGHLFGMNDMLSGEHKDKLDLAGLLNVLDGVVDAPGRMVVMITEHPEWLDPALIRPGRFSARLRFDYIEMAALVSMLGLYYGDVVHAACGVGDAVAAEEARARAARAVHRELSGAQAAAVRAAVAALEAEAVARGEGCGYRFQVTPCEVEMLCMEQDTLDGFLSQLAALVRGVLTV